MPRNALTLKQQRELHSQILRGVPTDITRETYDYWRANGNELNAVIREVLSRIPPTPAKSKLLKLETTIELPAVKNFSAKDRFQVGDVEDIKISWIGSNFQTAFLSDDGKVETDVAEATLRVHLLLKSSVNGPIIAELGGEEVAETTLARMFQFMKLRDCIKKDTWFIFYIRDANSVLWAVDCYLRSYGSLKL